jgi:ABC-type Na+ efflux pump permease subunit
MIRSMQAALIKKDLRAVTSNKRTLMVLFIVPLTMTVLLPSIFIFSMAMSSSDATDLQKLLALLPASARIGGLNQMMVRLLLNNILPLFFLIIPVMVASVTAGSSFVGEKEKRTQETLLYSPLNLRQIFSAKVLATFILSMMIALISFVLMLFVVEIETRIALGFFMLPGINWPILLLLVSPAIALTAITLIVRGSAKAQTVDEAQQKSVLLILPVVLLASGQFSGVMLIGPWALLGLGVVLAAVALLALRGSVGKFQYETLLK